MPPSFRSLRDIMEVTEEAGAVHPPSPTLSSGDGEKELEASSGKEVELVDSLIDLKQNEERTTPIEEQLLENLKKEIESTEKLEKPKKMVRVQSYEKVVDNAIVAHIPLKSYASVGTHFEKFELDSIYSAIKSNNADNTAMMEEAWESLQKSYVYYKGQPVGTLAAMDPTAEALNYNQVFVRDFVPSGLACLMKPVSAGGDPEIVKNFLLKTLHLQGWEEMIDNFTLGEGVMPASFKVLYDSHRQKETLVADFGGSAIGRVAPVDSGFWWIILLRSYTKSTHDYTLSEMPEVQKGMKLIINLCLSDGFDTFPTLLCADGCSMIDRRMLSHCC